jgi:hypothetical protein
MAVTTPDLALGHLTPKALDAAVVSGQHGDPAMLVAEMVELEDHQVILSAVAALADGE